MTALISHDRMTTERCIQYCYNLGYPYAGLQDGAECRCSDETYSDLGQASEDDCNTVCDGNPQEICGGGWRNSVYSTANLRCIVKASQRPTTNTPLNASVYQGCFKDSFWSRTMTAFVFHHGMTTEWCIQYCYDQGYPYAGLQNGEECRCSDETYSGLGQKPEDDCHTVCGGNPQEMCGGDWRNSVYSTANLEGCTAEVTQPSTTIGKPLLLKVTEHNTSLG
ncbi:WSC domain-containing protein ARB_07867-like isoform X2 [Anneissia japonica]|uniref:WSC domain-containing protein ARB_07867-like isoform X2 n=1 Tax=Anneissia japonica TaxID=1529436 RepID=UPI0014256C44|nr:WSC domain-containing protein ARB_07867-like isoform X2 [Anneissia japonica]